MRIIIAGAGFAGIQTALTLEKLFDPHKAEITVVNKRSQHIYRPDLYEVATAFNKEITEECKTQLKDSVAFPLEKILHRGTVSFLQDTITEIDSDKKEIGLATRGTLHFDYLAVTLGSVINYFDIPGLQKYSHTLKTATDAIKIGCDLDHLFHTAWQEKHKGNITIIVGGGGATGVELACEFSGYIDKLCKKYAWKRRDVSITVIEAGATLAGGDAAMTEAILKRLEKLHIACLRNTRITELEQKTVHLKEKNGFTSTCEYDFFVWTGGVKPHFLIATSFRHISPKGGLMVNGFLQSIEYPYIFAGGDNAAIFDKNHRPLPWLAQLAVQQGKLIGENIAAKINGEKLHEYVPYMKGIVIPLGQHYALFKAKHTLWKGRLMWLLRRLIDLTYAMSVLPKWYAFKKWWKATVLFTHND